MGAYDMTRAVKRVGVTCQIYPFVISLAADSFRLVKIILIREVSRNDRAIRGEKRVGMGWVEKSGIFDIRYLFLPGR